MIKKTEITSQDSVYSIFSSPKSNYKICRISGSKVRLEETISSQEEGRINLNLMLTALENLIDERLYLLGLIRSVESSVKLNFSDLQALSILNKAPKSIDLRAHVLILELGYESERLTEIQSRGEQVGIFIFRD